MMNEEPRPGISALAEAAGCADKPFTASSAAFTICPRINAAGRMGTAHKALDLLLCDDDDSAQLLAEEINQLNIQRQRTETEIFAQAAAAIESNPAVRDGKIIVVDGEGWHQALSA